MITFNQYCLASCHGYSCAQRDAKGHRGEIIWLKGLSSGPGRSTLAHATEELLYLLWLRIFILDSENVQPGLCADLTLSAKDLQVNIRKVGEVAKLYLEAGLMVLTAFISPFREDREKVRQMVNNHDFLEIYCDASIDVCEMRDVKGLYSKARSRLIAEFTGISAHYEIPEHPDLVIQTGSRELQEYVQQVVAKMIGNRILPVNESCQDNYI